MNTPSDDQEATKANENAGEDGAAESEGQLGQSATGEGTGELDPPVKGSETQADSEDEAGAIAEVAEEAPTPCALGISGLPVFVCHKTVEAFKIGSMEPLSGGDIQMFDETGDRSVTVTSAYVDKHKPQIGGYFVQYHGGYRSWSPADAFEDGYTAVYDEPEANVEEES